MNGFLLPSLSDSAPIRSVVSVAAAADQPTISAMYHGSVEMVLYRKTLKYMFSIVQANCPNRPMRISVIHLRADSFVVVFICTVTLRLYSVLCQPLHPYAPR